MMTSSSTSSLPPLHLGGGGGRNNNHHHKHASSLLLRHRSYKMFFLSGWCIILLIGLNSKIGGAPPSLPKEYYLLSSSSSFTTEQQMALQQHFLSSSSSLPLPLPPISELTQSSTSQRTKKTKDGDDGIGIAVIDCPYPLVPMYDYIVDDIDDIDDSNHYTTINTIPHNIHLAWIRPEDQYDPTTSRCISQDMMEIVMAWKREFPNYNIYFHDNIAVDKLFALPQTATAFPLLPSIMSSKCVQYGSAMKIDIWRVLILYLYGGIYSDFDVGPGSYLTPKMLDTYGIDGSSSSTTTTTENDNNNNNSNNNSTTTTTTTTTMPLQTSPVTAFFLTDAGGRPSQWLQGMEAKHPIAFYTMHEILQNLLALNNVANVRLVKTTGPMALRSGYLKAMDRSSTVNVVVVGGENNNNNDNNKFEAMIFENGHHMAKFNKVVLKMSSKHKTFRNSDQMVPYPRNATATTTTTTTTTNGTSTNNNNNTSTGMPTMITVKERIEKEMSAPHWTKQLRKGRRDGDTIRKSCMDLLYQQQQQQEQPSSSSSSTSS